MKILFKQLKDIVSSNLSFYLFFLILNISNDNPLLGITVSGECVEMGCKRLVCSEEFETIFLFCIFVLWNCVLWTYKKWLKFYIKTLAKFSDKLSKILNDLFYSHECPLRFTIYWFAFKWKEHRAELPFLRS